MLPWFPWFSKLPDLARGYAKAQPFPHIVLDEFLEPLVAKQALDIPALDSPKWIHYIHFNERVAAFNNFTSLNSSLQELIKALNSEAFTKFVSRLTGINDLFGDTTLEGGGLQVTRRGGFLNIHSDFLVHPHHPWWRRRVNFLLYLNEHWEDSWRGHLELWSSDMKQCVQKIAPLFNRCVIFNTDLTSFHGYPDRLTCPEGVTRTTLALYYYTHESKRPKIQSTNYKARPHDGVLKHLGICLDKRFLQGYDFLKRSLKIGDRFGSHVMKFLSRLRSR